MAGFTFTELTPAAFLDRSAVVFRDRLAIVDGEHRFSYGEFAERGHRNPAGRAAQSDSQDQYQRNE